MKERIPPRFERVSYMIHISIQLEIKAMGASESYPFVRHVDNPKLIEQIKNLNEKVVRIESDVKEHINKNDLKHESDEKRLVELERFREGLKFEGIHLKKYNF